MALDLAGTPLRLGDDLQVKFPESLSRLNHPDLLDLLARIDPTPDSMQDTGARDWADLPDRLHFIADLFRGYQEHPSLLAPPFAAAEVDIIKSGGMLV